MADMCYYGGFVQRFHDVMHNYRQARNQDWRGSGANAYQARYQTLEGRLWILGGVLNELEGAKGRLEALL